MATAITFENKSGHNVELVQTSNGTGQTLRKIQDVGDQQSVTINQPTPWAGRFQHTAEPTSTLVELNLDDGGQDWFNLSLVDGFNGGMKVIHSSGETLTVTNEDRSQAYEFPTNDRPEHGKQLVRAQPHGGSFTVTFL